MTEKLNKMINIISLLMR